MTPIFGRLYSVRGGQPRRAVATLQGKTLILNVDDVETDHYPLEVVVFDDPLPGVPANVVLPSGDKFEPEDHAFRWPTQTTQNALERLEQNKRWIIASLIGVPLLLWLIIAYLLPSLALYTAKHMPDPIIEQMGIQSHAMLKRTMLDESTLSADEKDDITALWTSTVKRLQYQHQALGINRSYALYFYDSEILGANALALPNGDVVVTDKLVRRLKENKNALVAVLLHEIGHVEQLHSARMASQSALTAIAAATLFGDLESLAEVLVGTGITVAQQQFSQQMEWEADAFALENLARLNMPKSALGDALEAIVASKKDEHNSMEHSVLDSYLSSHPDTLERIAASRR